VGIIACVGMGDWVAVNEVHLMTIEYRASDSVRPREATFSGPYIRCFADQKVACLDLHIT